MKPFFKPFREPEEVKLSVVLGKTLPEEEDLTDKLIKVQIIHNNG